MPPITPARQPNRLKFGSPAAELGLLTKGLASLEKHPLAELLFKDVTAFNIPKIALSRTWKERWDTATLELSNSGITLLSSLFLPRLVRWPVNRLAQLSEHYAGKDVLKEEFSKVQPRLAGKNLLPAKMARMGASFGFFFPFAAAFWAAPFARNWLTMKRTQSANFESMIGFNEVNAHQPKRTLQEEMAYQRNAALKTMATGLGLGIASLLTGGLLARRLGKSLRENLQDGLVQKLSSGQGAKMFERFFRTFDLKGNQVNGQTATLVFWGLPAYLGWVHGARSGNERRERVIQSANAIFWFFFASKLTTPLWRKGYKELLKPETLAKCKQILDAKDAKTVGSAAKTKIEDRLLSLSYQDILKDFEKDIPLRNQLLKFKNAKFALNDLGVPISTLSAVQLFNFSLTERKIKATQPVQPSFQTRSTNSLNPFHAPMTPFGAVIPGFVPATSANGWSQPQPFPSPPKAF
jgi:hypothetical protein